MRHLVVSAQPAVVFTSLAALCVPAFSDECRIIIEEEGHVGYRIIRPVPDPGSQLAALSQEYVSREGGSRQLVGARIVRTPIVAMQLSGERYRGVVVHHWHTGRHPTRADVARAQRIVDRAVVTVHQERLTSRLGQQRCTTENLQQALGAGANPEIDAAIGILMTCRGVPYAQAFDLLRIASRQSHRKVARSRERRRAYRPERGGPGGSDQADPRSVACPARDADRLRPRTTLDTVREEVSLTERPRRSPRSVASESLRQTHRRRRGAHRYRYARRTDDRRRARWSVMRGVLDDPSRSSAVKQIRCRAVARSRG